MFRILLSVLIVPLILGLSGCASKNTTQSLLKEYRETLEKQKRAGIASENEDVSKKVLPMTAEGYEKKGDQYLNEGNPDLAFIQYSRSLHLNPKQPRIQFEMGRLFLQKGFYEEARQKFQEVLRANPQHAAAYDGMGRVCFFTRRYPEAEDYFRKALTFDSTRWEAHNFLGIIYDYQKEYDRAAHEYRTALGIKPHAAVLFNNLGISLLWKGDFEEAARAFTEALKFGNSSRKVHNNLAFALGKLGRNQEALESFRKGGDVSSAYYNLGRVHMMEGHYQEAARAFEKAIDTRPVYYPEAKQSLENAKALAAAIGSPAKAVVKPPVDFVEDTKHDDSIIVAGPVERSPAEHPAPAVEEKGEGPEPGTLDPASSDLKETTLSPISVECDEACESSVAETENPLQHQVTTFVADPEFSLQASSELERLLSTEPDPPRVEAFALSTLPALNDLSEGSPEPLISVGPNDDFNLEILPADKNLPEFDIPIVMNKQVEYFIRYFQTSLKGKFSGWLARSEKYISLMRNVLKENGLPEDLVYLSLIESGFNPHAYSKSKASGLWQFIYGTGKRYGLKANWWVDERRDPEKSTLAAARYLKDLYDMFECWYLAAAGYNAGENKISNAIKRYQTEDFWELIKYPYLKKETKDYVAQMIAAALIAKDPEKYNFTSIEYDEPLRYEKVSVPELTDLAFIARACEVPLEELKELNPELLRGCTPPDISDYEIRIPYGKRALFLRNFEPVKGAAKFQFKTHTVKKSESLPRIAKLYRVDMEPILDINHLGKGARLSAGAKLLIPLPKDQAAGPTLTEIQKPDKNRIAPREIVHRINKGDTLWSIARKYNVSISEIKSWNNLNGTSQIRPSDQLKLKVGSSTLN